jgi:hypothetical protein
VANVGKKAPRARNAATNEVENRLRHAAEYLGAMLQHEAASNAAATSAQMDLDAQREASRLFERDLLSFLGAARTAWNYLNQIADAAGCRDWLDDRLSGRIFRFHRELANQDTHDYQVTPGVNQKVRVEGYQGIPRLQEGSLHLPITLNVTGVDSVTFVYEPKNLEPDVVPLLEEVAKEYGTKGIIELASRYYDGLSQVTKSAGRRGRFDVRSAAEGQE